MNNNELNPYMIACNHFGMEKNAVPGESFGVRIVRWYELELIDEANQGYIINVDHRIKAEKGVLMIRKPGAVVAGISSYGCKSLCFDSHYEHLLEAYYDEKHFLNPNSDLLQKMLFKGCPFLDQLPESILVSDYDKFNRLFEQALNLYIEKNESYSIASKRLMFDLFELIEEELILFSMRQLEASNTNGYKAVVSSVGWIDEHFAEDISLADLAERVGYSREALSRLFKAQLNISPIDYVIKQRILQAKRLLMITSMSIYEISLACGFKSDTYFYTIFKKREGLSPSRFRMLHNRL